MKITLGVTVAALFITAAANAQNVSVTASVTPGTNVNTYTYVFADSNATVSNLYLEVDDLNPLNVSFSKEIFGASVFTPTTDWAYLDASSTTLGFTSSTDQLDDGDQLQVVFSSSKDLFTPTNTHSAYAYDNASGADTTAVGGLVGPTAAPEPGALTVLGLGVLSGVFHARRRGQKA